MRPPIAPMQNGTEIQATAVASSPKIEDLDSEGQGDEEGEEDPRETRSIFSSAVLAVTSTLLPLKRAAS